MFAFLAVEVPNLESIKVGSCDVSGFAMFPGEIFPNMKKFQANHFNEDLQFPIESNDFVKLVKGEFYRVCFGNGDSVPFILDESDF